MLARFKQYIEQQHLFGPTDEVLLAVSGGVDSTVFCHLMQAAGYRFGVAHCNFNLRPGDCDRDELFVRTLSVRMGARFHVAHFDTRHYASENHLSIEEAARNLRYDFFEQLRVRYGYAAIATAHHSDDSAETFFINLMRGTGIAGLHGIRPRSGYVVRPLLGFGRADIMAYAEQHGIEFVTDVTNSSLDYRRNQVRHQLLPLLRDLSPGFDATLARTIAHLSDTEVVYRQAVDRLHDRLLVVDGQRHSYPIAALVELEPRRTLLFELLRPYGFNASDVADIEVALGAESGRLFQSPTHRLLRDRQSLIIEPLGRPARPPKLVLTQLQAADFDPAEARRSKLAAYFDASTLALPLQVRRWQPSDRFTPFGMKGSKLVSDLLSDLKINLFDKERTYILCDADGKILWVIGLRTSEHHRVTCATASVLRVEAVFEE
ncbi:MAG: tRNA lysidine(34) synthetase TilS [Bacteroidales bacterium]|nr:tRNA lysidine(34) synthetase TilS [Bacteroidales bacterium]